MKVFAGRINRKNKTELTEWERQHLAWGISMSHVRGRAWTKQNAMSFWTHPLSSEVKKVMDRFSLNSKTLRVEIPKYDVAYEEEIPFTRFGEFEIISFSTINQSSWDSKVRETRPKIVYPKKELMGNGSILRAKRYSDFPSIAQAEYQRRFSESREVT